MIVAIDGPAASGKGTLARRIARHLGRPHLDTGLLYRAVAQAMLAAGDPLGDEAAATRAAEHLEAGRLDEAELRRPEMSEAASIVSAIPAVRAALLATQRRFAAQPGGAVLDGRDIATVVCPSADVKLYVTAAIEERARRRHRELDGTDDPRSYDAVLEDLRRRDRRDETRETAPLRLAAGAILLDTTDLDAEAAFRCALALIEDAVAA